MATPKIATELIRQEGACRWLRLSGDAEGELWYNAHGALYESVELDGVQLVRMRNTTLRLHYWLLPRLDFTLPTAAGPADAVIEVRLLGYRDLSGFRLSVGGTVIYDEGLFAEYGDPDLPRPAWSPPPDTASYPVAS